MERFLKSLEPGSAVALEAGLNWMWMVEQIEKADLEPHLTNPLEAKKRMSGVNKFDSRDAAGLLILLRSGTLPEVWIPRGARRDLRGLVRSRLVLRRHVSGLKCRIDGVRTQHGLKPLEEEEDEVEYRDWFTAKARQALLKAMEELPPADTGGIAAGVPGDVGTGTACPEPGSRHSDATRAAGLDSVVADDAWRGLDSGGHDSGLRLAM